MLFHHLTGVRLASGLQRKWELVLCTHTGCEAMRASEETTHSRSPVSCAGSPRHGASYWTLSPYRMIHDDASQDIGASASALQLACRVPLQQRREPGWDRGGAREEATATWCSTYPGRTGRFHSLHQLSLHSPFATLGPDSPPSVRGTDSRNWRIQRGALGEEQRRWAMGDGHEQSKVGSAGHMKPPPSPFVTRQQWIVDVTP